MGHANRRGLGYTRGRRSFPLPGHMTQDRIRLLQLMPVFGAVHSDALAFILDRSHDLSVPGGGFFFREGSEANGFFVLESGSVEILREHDGVQVHLTGFGVGDCFGEMAIVECRNRNASMRALEDCGAVNVPLSALHDLYE